MKRNLLVLGVLLVATLASQCLTLRHYSQLRGWFADSNPNVLLVGVSWPFAVNQDGMENGLRLAEAEINKEGLRGRRIQLVMRDDGLDRETGRQIAIEFAHTPRMVAVIGYYDDKLAIRASSIFEEARLLHIITGSNHTYMTSHGFRYLVRSIMANDLLAHGIARLCVDRGFRSFAVVAEEGAFGDDLAFHFTGEVDGLGGRVVYRTAFVPGTVDFRDTLNEIGEVRPDVVFFAGFETENADFIRLARETGFSTPIVGSFSDTPMMRARTGPALEGAMSYEVYDVSSPSPKNREFVATYRQRFGTDPDAAAAQGYDALYLLAKAMALTGSIDGLDLAYGIRRMDPWNGANGAYEFDNTGELLSKDLYLKVHRGGQSILLATTRPSMSEDLHPGVTR